MRTRANPFLSGQLRTLFPKPLADSPVLELLYIAELLILQDFILPQIFGHKLFIDLLTPWLVILFVFRSPAHVFLIATAAVLLLETHAGLPRGLLVCFYWSLGIGIHFIRQQISWSSPLPWISVLLLSQAGLAVLETLSYWTQNFSTIYFSHISFVSLIVNRLISCMVGLYIVLYFRLDTLQEHRLARR